MPKLSKHDDAVHGYDDTYLLCRDIRHVWEVVGFFRLSNGLVRRVLDCSRCGTQRSDTWSLSGERHPAHYSYVDGYQMSGGMEQYEVRKEVLSRARIFKSADEMFEAVSTASTKKVPRSSRRAS